MCSFDSFGCCSSNFWIGIYLVSYAASKPTSVTTGNQTILYNYGGVTFFGICCFVIAGILSFFLVLGYCIYFCGWQYTFSGKGKGSLKFNKEHNEQSVNKYMQSKIDKQFIKGGCNVLCFHRENTKRYHKKIIHSFNQDFPIYFHLCNDSSTTPKISNINDLIALRTFLDLSYEDGTGTLDYMNRFKSHCSFVELPSKSHQIHQLKIHVKQENTAQI